MCIFCAFMKIWGWSWGNLLTKYEKELSVNLMFHKTKFDKTKTEKLLFNGQMFSYSLRQDRRKCHHLSRGQHVLCHHHGVPGRLYRLSPHALLPHLHHWRYVTASSRQSRRMKDKLGPRTPGQLDTPHLRRNLSSFCNKN